MSQFGAQEAANKASAKRQEAYLNRFKGTIGESGRAFTPGVPYAQAFAVRGQPGGESGRTIGFSGGSGGILQGFTNEVGRLGTAASTVAQDGEGRIVLDGIKSTMGFGASGDYGLARDFNEVRNVFQGDSLYAQDQANPPSTSILHQRAIDTYAMNNPGIAGWHTTPNMNAGLNKNTTPPSATAMIADPGVKMAMAVSRGASRTALNSGLAGLNNSTAPNPIEVGSSSVIASSGGLGAQSSQDVKDPRVNLNSSSMGMGTGAPTNLVNATN